MRGHRRTGSHGNPIILTTSASAASLTPPVAAPRSPGTFALESEKTEKNWMSSARKISTGTFVVESQIFIWRNNICKDSYDADIYTISIGNGR